MTRRFKNAEPANSLRISWKDANAEAHGPYGITGFLVILSAMTIVAWVVLVV